MPRATNAPSARKSNSAAKSFRVGQVKAYLRGRVWYLQYHEHGVRRRPRVGPDREAARRLAAQTNAQLATRIKHRDQQPGGDPQSDNVLP